MVCHTNEKAFACEICGQAFRTKQRLLAHNRHHTGEKPFKCDVEVRYKQRMEAHICHHTSEMPFK